MLPTLPSNKHYFYLFLVLITLFEGIAVYFAFQQSPWGDELHFYETVKYFGQGISLQTLTNYNEMSTPLPFILYALWGKLFGFELNALRGLSVIIALFTYCGFYFLLAGVTRNLWLVFWASLFLVVHPYMVGFSLFVFTDMLPITASIFGLIALRKNSSWLWFFWAAIGLLSRQYFVFFSLPVGIYYCLRFIAKPGLTHVKMAVATLFSTLPTVALFWLWGGFSPQNNINHLYLGEAFSYHVDYLTLYVALLFVYLCPFIIWRWKEFYTDKIILIISLILSGLYLIFPVHPCPAAIEAGFDSVGYFQTLLQNLHFRPSGVQIIFYCCYLLGWPVLLTLLKDLVKRVMERAYDTLFLLEMSLLSFFIIMPSSYLLWEKYFVPVIPLAVIAIIKFKRR